MRAPLVSVVIPTRNSSEFLSKCLDSIKNQSYKNIDVTIIDQGSEDTTLRICKRFKTKIVQLLPSKVYAPPTKSRNRGAKESKGKYLLHLDSDMELTPKVIEECVELCGNKDCGAVIIHEVDIAKGFWGRCKALERRCYIGDTQMEAARFVERSVFEEVGGYDENLNSGEDWDIHIKYKGTTQIGSVPSFIKHNQGKLKLVRILKKKYEYGKTFGPYIRKHPEIAKRQLTIFRPAYIRNWRLFLKDPVHSVGVILMKVCEFIAGGVGLMRG